MARLHGLFLRPSPISFNVFSPSTFSVSGSVTPDRSPARAAVPSAETETRKEKGEPYSALRRFFRQHKRVFVVADERDVVRLRTNVRGTTDLFMCSRLQIDIDCTTTRMAWLRKA